MPIVTLFVAHGKWSETCTENFQYDKFWGHFVPLCLCAWMPRCLNTSIENRNSNPELTQITPAI